MAEPSGARFGEMLAALSQPARLRIVDVATEGGPEGTAAGDIARAVRCPPSTLSFHLKELTRCGLLQASQHGRYIRYAVRPAAFAALADFIAGLPDGGTPRRGPRVSKKKRRPGAGKAPGKGAAGTAGQLSIFGD